MKNLIFLGLACLWMPVLYAQSDRYAGGSKVNIQTMQSGMAEVDWFGRVVVYQQSNKEIVRFEVDDNSRRMVRDKSLFQDLDAMTSYRYESTLEALNVLSSRGWTLTSTMAVKTNRGEEQHYIVAFPVASKAMSPWLRKDTKGTGGKQ